MPDATSPKPLPRGSTGHAADGPVATRRIPTPAGPTRAGGGSNRLATRKNARTGHPNVTPTTFHRTPSTARHHLARSTLGCGLPALSVGESRTLRLPPANRRRATNSLRGGITRLRESERENARPVRVLTSYRAPSARLAASGRRPCRLVGAWANQWSRFRTLRSALLDFSQPPDAATQLPPVRGRGPRAPGTSDCRSYRPRSTGGSRLLGRVRTPPRADREASNQRPPRSGRSRITQRPVRRPLRTRQHPSQPTHGTGIQRPPASSPVEPPPFVACVVSGWPRWKAPDHRHVSGPRRGTRLRSARPGRHRSVGAPTETAPPFCHGPLAVRSARLRPQSSYGAVTAPGWRQARPRCTPPTGHPPTDPGATVLRLGGIRVRTRPLQRGAGERGAGERAHPSPPSRPRTPRVPRHRVIEFRDFRPGRQRWLVSIRREIPPPHTHPPVPAIGRDSSWLESGHPWARRPSLRIISGAGNERWRAPRLVPGEPWRPRDDDGMHGGPVWQAQRSRAYIRPTNSPEATSLNRTQPGADHQSSGPLSEPEVDRPDTVNQPQGRGLGRAPEAPSMVTWRRPRFAEHRNADSRTGAAVPGRAAHSQPRTGAPPLAGGFGPWRQNRRPVRVGDAPAKINDLAVSRETSHPPSGTARGASYFTATATPPAARPSGAPDTTASGP